mmetsp:Transcript_21045/g.66496  ORF Transcript_21045/g.66496 Transcript_21045/m.66496 type:complete len:212 (-) Transcript_21045:1171-1806(-)
MLPHVNPRRGPWPPGFPSPSSERPPRHALRTPAPAEMPSAWTERPTRPGCPAPWQGRWCNSPRQCPQAGSAWPPQLPTAAGRPPSAQGGRLPWSPPPARSGWPVPQHLQCSHVRHGHQQPELEAGKCPDTLRRRPLASPCCRTRKTLQAARHPGATPLEQRPVAQPGVCMRRHARAPHVAPRPPPPAQGAWLRAPAADSSRWLPLQRKRPR